MDDWGSVGGCEECCGKLVGSGRQYESKTVSKTISHFVSKTLRGGQGPHLVSKTRLRRSDGFRLRLLTRSDGGPTEVAGIWAAFGRYSASFGDDHSGPKV